MNYIYLQVVCGKGVFDLRLLGYSDYMLAHPGMSYVLLSVERNKFKKINN